jgi:hypothetical protein
MIRPVHSLVLNLITPLVLGAAAGPKAVLAGEPSPAYKASLQRTRELRKERRRVANAPRAGVIVPYPMPPSLIIRQTPDVHDEIESLLRLLRGGPR